MTGKFIQLTQLNTFLTKLKEWVSTTFLAKSDAAAVATSGAAADVSVADSQSHFTGTNVEAVLNELYTAIGSGGTAAAVTVTENSSPSSTSILKEYVIAQGGSTVGTISIPKDLVVTSGSIVTGTWSGSTFTEDATQPGSGTGKALKLVIANQTDPVYINVADLVDVYTAQTSATKIQLAISASNVISASVVAGSIAKTDLVSAVQTSLGLADTALQEADIVIATDTDINGLFTS